MTIDRDTWIVARPRRDRQIRISSLNVDSGATFELSVTKIRGEGHGR